MRRHLSYANVAATLALVFSMSGGALAASHYLINSTKQINPKVLKKLKGTGKTGTTGPRGPAGANGAAGGQGAAGSQGAKGTTGPAGLSALSVLPSGHTESGDYGIGTPGGTGGEILEETVTFPVPLGEELPASQVIYTTVPPVTHCSGPGNADKGFLCIYSSSSFLVGTPLIKNPENGSRPTGTGRFGFFLDWKITGPDAFDQGTYAVTAA
jgi:hypothetical protein